ncbi:MAG: single-stranded-DNA-specific exonuclease RecJ [Helicobacteraceae bacterium]|jgi:single-stranded-DNA-specific exonuclease|nr:single-stranded-DNA-specific exonuclease RecJ [Helicobacteraceae bacterium]
MAELTCAAVREILAARFHNDAIKKLADLDPPSAFIDLDRAVLRITDAIKGGEPIAIAGDYDADGVIACAILSEILTKAGARYAVYLPDRFTDGYGINARVVDRIAENLIITVDNGIAAFEAADRAKSLGKTLIITDHHQCGFELPQAYAIVNPKRADCPSRDKNICGAAVAWYLAAGIARAAGVEYDAKEALALVAIATIADCAPLVGANRAMTRTGLRSLAISKRPFAELLRREFPLKEGEYRDFAIDSRSITFRIVPPLNAAGRLSSARLAYDFLTAPDFSAAATAWARLEELCEERRTLESRVFEDALASLDDASENRAALVAAGVNWHEGVVGIVAARLAEKFEKIAVVLTANGDTAKGSARGWAGYDLYEILKKCESDLIKFGGHKGAAGLTISCEKIDDFKRKFLEICANYDCDQTEIKNAKRKMLGEIEVKEINAALKPVFEDYEPYGDGNPKPIFFARDFTIREMYRVGQGDKHIYFKFTNNLSAIYFNAPQYDLRAKTISFHYTVSFGIFRGKIQTKLKIIKIEDY